MSLNQETETSAAAGPAPATKILVVDDSAIDRRIASGIVEKRPGLQAISASNGDEALVVIDREGPTLVLTDMQMPGMDGLELVKEIRLRHPRIPVIVMTAYGSEDIAFQALRAGAASYVPKKSLASDLGATIQQVLAAAAVDNHRQRLLERMEGRRTRFQLGNEPELFGPLISLLQEDLSGLDFCDETVRVRVGIALQEALANALYHGNLEVSSDLRQDDEREFYKLANLRRSMEPYQKRRILVDANFDREAATFAIRDEGPGFDISILDKPIDPDDLMRIGGRGLLLIRTFMDKVEHNESGNEITLVKQRSRKVAS